MKWACHTGHWASHAEHIRPDTAVDSLVEIDSFLRSIYTEKNV